MKRVIFDTNVYGKLILEKDFTLITKSIVEDKQFVVYGFGLIRKELRETPKCSLTGRHHTRSLLLTTYDTITEDRCLAESDAIMHLSRKLYSYYRKSGGIKSWKKTNISVDLMIVACAILNGLDILVSDDLRTLLSKPALNAYAKACKEQNMSCPILWKYSDLKKKYDF